MNSSATNGSAEYGNGRFWPKRILAATVLILPLGLLIQGIIFFKFAGSSDLLAAIEETDRLDPHWRLSDLEAKRLKIPDAENSARVIVAVCGLERPGTSILPHGWPDPKKEEAIHKFWETHEPAVRLNPPTLKLIRDELSRAAAGLQEILKIADMPRGRYTTHYEKNIYMTLLPHIHPPRRGAKLLQWNVARLLEEEKISEAARSCRAAICVASSFHDDPLTISLLVRYGIRTTALESCERLLAQGVVDDRKLSSLQEALEMEEQSPGFYWVARGERAFNDHFYNALRSGDVSYKEITHMYDRLQRYTGNENLDDWLNIAVAYYRYGAINKNHAAILRIANQHIEIARLPVEDRGEPLQMMEEKHRNDTALAARLVLSYRGVAEADQISIAALRCHIAAFACERFRLAEGRWPTALAELSPRYLPAVPLDPYTKTPLRFKPTADGLTIYSVALDKTDNGGNLDRKNRGQVKDSDIGVRLWNPSHRRQAAP